ncbi:MAG: hypothetical protein ACI9TH_002686 [Kiritimatiellia bacterium]|jgi:hypothetical protein
MPFGGDDLNLLRSSFFVMVEGFLFANTTHKREATAFLNLNLTLLLRRPETGRLVGLVVPHPS